MDMVNILRKFVKAEHTGNWNLHQLVVSEMLPYMAASGHDLYAKSARIYLQQMCNLGTQHPDIQQNFEAGYDVIRQVTISGPGWLSSGLIEQVLMTRQGKLVEPHNRARDGEAMSDLAGVLGSLCWGE